jgi:hypothetical protein
MKLFALSLIGFAMFSTASPASVDTKYELSTAVSILEKSSPQTKVRSNRNFIHRQYKKVAKKYCFKRPPIL